MPRWSRVLRIVLLSCATMIATLMTAYARDARPPRSAAYFVTVAPDHQPPVKIYVEEMGRGPTVLLLHGLGGSSYSWRFIAPRLAETHRVVAIDLRGFGRSDKPFDQVYRPADHVAVVRAVIKALDLKRVTLIGHSFGGMLSLMLALDRRLEPHRIARLALLSVPAYPQPYSVGVSFLNRPVVPYLAFLLMPSELVATVALMTEKFGFERVTDRDISIYADPLSAPGGPHALIATGRQIVPHDLHRIIARYPTIRKPTLAISCREDQAVPVSSSQRLARTIPGAALAVLDGCDHLPAEQAPAAVVRELRRFLAR